MSSNLHFIYLGETTFQQDRLNEFLNASKILEIPELGDVQKYDQDVKQEPRTNLTIGTKDDQKQDDKGTMENEHEDPLLGTSFQDIKQQKPGLPCDECTAPHNKTCAFVQRLLEALKINLEIKVR